MLNPTKKTEHLLFSDFLTPPEGFPNLECVIATTYSLDISALISCMVSLAFGDDIDGVLPIDKDLAKNNVKILSSLERLSKKMVVFCDSGQIKVSRSKNKEFALLLENIIFPVNLPKIGKSYPSFHPKMWLLHFSNNHGENHYRLVVLSRNISFDKTYDISLVLEGDGLDESKEDDLKKTKKILDYIEYLKRVSPVTEQQVELIDALIGKMKKEKVCFKIDDNVFDNHNYDIVPIYHTKKEDNLSFEEQLFQKKKKYDKILIISPFVAYDFLLRLKERMANDNPKNIKVVTREKAFEEILKKSKRKCRDEFEFYKLNPGIVCSVPQDVDSLDGGEDKDETINDGLYDIHAKLFLLESKSNKNLIIGSANATNSAFSANHELVVKLCSKKKQLSVNKFFKELNTEKKNFFVRMENSSSKDSTSAIQKKVENDIRLLSHISARGTVIKYNGKYKVVLIFNEMPNIEGNAYIRMLSSEEKKSFSKKMCFENLSVEEISEFFYISVENKDWNKLIKMERIIKISLEKLPNDERKRQLINKVISDSESLAEYISLMLGNDSILSRIKRNGSGGGQKWNNPYNQAQLYEKLLRASVSNPQIVLNLKDCFELISNKKVMSDELKSLYKCFRSALDSENIGK